MTDSEIVKSCVFLLIFALFEHTIWGFGNLVRFKGAEFDDVLGVWSIDSFLRRVKED